MAPAPPSPCDSEFELFSEVAPIPGTRQMRRGVEAPAKMLTVSTSVSEPFEGCQLSCTQSPVDYTRK